MILIFFCFFLTLGHSNDVKSRSKTYSFSGITVKRGLKKERKGKKKQKFVRGYKGATKHRNEKLNNPKNRNRTSKFSKNSSKQGRNNMKGKPSR